MPFIPVAEYAPDQPDFQNPGSGNILNVLPRTAQSYGPWAGLSPFSTGTNPAARVQGAYACIDTAGNVSVFCGDASKLYQLTAGATTFSDVSIAAGYTTGSDERWAAALFGTKAIFTNFHDVPQYFDVASSTAFANLITTGTTSLKARYIAVVRDWVVLGNTNDDSNGAQPQRVWWSSIDDATNFPTPGSSTATANQSDFQDLVGDAGWVQGIVGNLGTADGAVFQERAVWRMIYQGPPTIFGFYPAEGVRGTPAPGSIVQVSNLAYYLGEDGFYAFDGTASRPIGVNRVDKTFFADLDQSFFFRISAAVDPINKIVYWAYPGSGHDGSGNCNRIIAYNYAVDRWAITAAGDVTCEILMRSLTPGYSLDTLDTLISNIDTGSQISFDSRVYTAGRSVLAAFDTSHTLNTFTGDNLAPTIDTAETELIPGRRAIVLNGRPIVDGGTPSLTPITRNRIEDSTSVGTAVAMNSDGNCPMRAEGRYHRMRLTLPANSSFTHISGIQIDEARDIVPGGIR